MEQRASASEISKIASDIIQHLGGRENILEFENCITRLRFQLKELQKEENDALKKAGVLAVYHSGSELQLVVGSDIFYIADEIQKQIGNP